MAAERPISRADGEEHFARVEEALAAGRARAPIEFAVRQEYAKGVLRRFIMFSGGIVTLIQKEQRPAPDSRPE